MALLDYVVLDHDAQLGTLVTRTAAERTDAETLAQRCAAAGPGTTKTDPRIGDDGDQSDGDDGEWVALGGVIGPLLSDDPGTSVTAIQQIMVGALPMIPDLRLPWIDVRDVADAHIEAMTAETAGGSRTFVATDPSSLIEVAAVLRERLPEASEKMPTRAMPTWLTWVASMFEPQLRDNRWLIGLAQRFDRRPAEALLGRPLRSILDTIEETGRSLVEHGLV